MFSEAGGVLETPFYKRTVTYTQYNTESLDVTSSSPLSLTPGLAGKLGMKYMLNDRQSISLSPEIRYYFNPSSLSSASGNNKPIWLGFDLAYRF